MPAGRSRRPLPLREISDEAFDILDVPATVVCTLCGRGDCTGCFADDEATGASRVLTIVPWERSGIGFFAGLFSTMQAATRNPEAFFVSLPDGGVSPALGFAFAAEVCAVASSALVITPLVVLGIPGLLAHCVASGAARQGVVLSALVGIAGFSALLVVAHAIHGFVLGFMGSRESAFWRERALRFGLYACGWDLGSSPLGVVAAGIEGGPRGSISILAASVSAPARATKAVLPATFHLEGERAARARRRAIGAAMALTVPAVIVILALMALAAIYG